MKSYSLNTLRLAVVLLFTTIYAQAQKDYRMYDIPESAKINKLVKMINEDPSDAEAHYWYINTMGNDTAGIEKQYVTWINKSPKTGIFPYQLGHLYMQHDAAKAQQYLGLAVKANPQLVKAWQDLYLLAYFNGDKDAISILKNALIVNPGNSELTFSYAYTFKLTDSKKYRSALNEIASKQNIDIYNVKAATLLAEITDNYPEKKRVYEEIREKYLDAYPKYSSEAMIQYYLLLLEKETEKTIPLIQSLLKMKTRPYDWGNLLFITKSVMNSRELLAAGKGVEALAILNSIKPPYFIKASQLPLNDIKAASIAMHDGAQSALDSLIHFFMASPSFGLYKSIMKYGKMLNHDSLATVSYLKSKFSQNVKPASSFKLRSYTTPDSISLDSLKGNLILLTYWYPRCGPCRAEMPYFEKTLKQINKENIKYLAINIVPEQASEVLKLIKQENYSFIPLEESKNRNKGNLDNLGAAPSNFIIDKEGYLVFSNFYIDEDNSGVLQLMLDLAR